MDDQGWQDDSVAMRGVGDIVPLGWRHPVTGRHKAVIDVPLLRAGRHLRRARYLAGYSQQRLATEARVAQSQVSRFERALAPAMKAERLARVAAVLHPNFPIGYCPHDHRCPWQLIAVPDPSLLVADHTPDVTRILAAVYGADPGEPRQR